MTLSVLGHIFNATLFVVMGIALARAWKNTDDAEITIRVLETEIATLTAKVDCAKGSIEECQKALSRMTERFNQAKLDAFSLAQQLADLKRSKDDDFAGIINREFATPLNDYERVEDDNA